MSVPNKPPSNGSSIKEEYPGLGEGLQTQKSKAWHPWANRTSIREENQTQRGMKSRHLMMIGGWCLKTSPWSQQISCIYSLGWYDRNWDFLERRLGMWIVPVSTDLAFIGGATQAISLAGPGSALLSYFVVGVFVYTVVISLWVFWARQFLTSTIDV